MEEDGGHPGDQPAPPPPSRDPPGSPLATRPIPTPLKNSCAGPPPTGECPSSGSRLPPQPSSPFLVLPSAPASPGSGSCAEGAGPHLQCPSPLPWLCLDLPLRVSLPPPGSPPGCPGWIQHSAVIPRIPFATLLTWNVTIRVQSFSPLGRGLWICLCVSLVWGTYPGLARIPATACLLTAMSSSSQ